MTSGRTAHVGLCGWGALVIVSVLVSVLHTLPVLGSLTRGCFMTSKELTFRRIGQNH